MSNIIRKITLTELGENAGPNFMVEFSTDCINYSASLDCTNVFLPTIGSFANCTVDFNTSCIRLTSLSAGCGNSVIEDLDPTPTTTTTTTQPTTTTSTTQPTTTTSTTQPTTTTSTTEPTTTTSTTEPTTTTSTTEPTTTTSTTEPTTTTTTTEPTTTTSTTEPTTTTTTTEPTTTTSTTEPTTTTSTTSTTTTSTTSTTTTSTTSTTTTSTTTVPPSTDCYVIETVQSAPGECFDCPGFFASSTDTIIRFLDDCSGSIIPAPFDINVEARYSDNSTGSTFISGGTVGDVLIAFSDVQCVEPPTCGEIASPTFMSASVVPVSGSIGECCETTTTTTTDSPVSGN